MLLYRHHQFVIGSLVEQEEEKKRGDEECAVRRVADPLNEEGREREMSVFFRELC